MRVPTWGRGGRTVPVKYPQELVPSTVESLKAPTVVEPEEVKSLWQVAVMPEM
jgi:hypothetical protein